MFAEFIDQSGETRCAWAAKLGISKSHMSDLLRGNRQPSLDLAVRIDRITAGAVPVSAWVAKVPGTVDSAESIAVPPEEDAA